MSYNRNGYDKGAVPTRLVTAKGDLVTATAADTPARLPVGDNGDTLLADSSQTTGLRYNPPVGSLGNPVINGGMDIWQRGTSFSFAASTAYTNGMVADRWQTSTGANQACTISRQLTGDTTNLPNIQYCLRYQRNSGQTGTGSLPLVQSFETVNSIPLAGKAITFSFYARAGANYSHSASALAVDLLSGTGTDENRLAGYTGNVGIISTSATLTTTWQRFAFTGTVPTNSTELAIYLQFTPTGTAGANDYYEITGLQIDLGTYTASSAPTFRRSGGTLQGELAACQRYYWRTSNPSAFALHGTGLARSTTEGQFLVTYPVAMRVAPTSLDFSNLEVTNAVALSSAITGASISQASSYTASVYTSGSSGLTADRVYFLGNNNSTSGYIGFSAEL